MTAASSGAVKPTRMSVSAAMDLAVGSLCSTLLKMLAPTWGEGWGREGGEGGGGGGGGGGPKARGGKLEAFAALFCSEC